MQRWLHISFYALKMIYYMFNAQQYHINNLWHLEIKLRFAVSCDVWWFSSLLWETRDVLERTCSKTDSRTAHERKHKIFRFFLAWSRTNKSRGHPEGLPTCQGPLKWNTRGATDAFCNRCSAAIALGSLTTRPLEVTAPDGPSSAMVMMQLEASSSMQ